MSKPEFRYVIHIEATPERVWQGLTEADLTRLYWGVGLKSDWAAGSVVHWQDDRDPEGRFVDLGMRVLTAEPGRLLSYTWHPYQPEDRVEFGWTEEEFAAASEEESAVAFELERIGSSVKLTLTHSGFTDPGSRMLLSVTDGWPSVLSRLKTVLETGAAPGGTHREWYRAANY
jgi:uncharacterized protein YndB with AHSA1/START domain